jgi:hypothetical protein
MVPGLEPEFKCMRVLDRLPVGVAAHRGRDRREVGRPIEADG